MCTFLRSDSEQRKSITLNAAEHIDGSKTSPANRIKCRGCFATAGAHNQYPCACVMDRAHSSTCSVSTAEGHARRQPHGLALKRLPLELGASGAPESLCRLPGRFEGRCGIFSCHSDSRLNVGQTASSRSSKHG